MQAVTLEAAQRLASLYESTLRGSFRPDPLPEEWERTLAATPADTPMRAIARYGLLKGYYALRYQELEARKRPPEEAEKAAHQLATREPVRVRIGSREVGVTGRSAAAMHEIARRELRALEVEEDLARIGELRRATLAELRRRRVRGRGALRRRLRRLEQLHGVAFEEWTAQRRLLYAHLFTPTGAPASSAAEAPAWWEEIGPEEDARLILAALEAGPGRYLRAAAASPPPPKERPGKERASLGYRALLATLERHQRVEPGSYHNVDYYQLMQWVRDGAPPVPEELEG